MNTQPSAAGGAPSELASMLAFAVESAQLAGARTLGYFNAQTPVEWKADKSPVTAADKGAEQCLRDRIERYYPSHGILGEEFGEKAAADPSRTPARWILDPIDGTFSFIHGVPLYSVLVGLEWGGRMVAGVIHMPALRETVYAGQGLGCWWDGKRARVSSAAELSRATLLTGGGKLFETTGRMEVFTRLIRSVGVHRSWCDGYAYALLATGRADIVVDPKMAMWDVAALVPVIREAGGRVSSWAGQDTHLTDNLYATGGGLHEAVGRLLNQS